ncbi:hypothetical protein [Legionella santicrucis]|uniref:hypothetical protein n=1 Tax=Legionella santicrucis TaxID=45074 RepID=UPI0007317E42|nr:hypothetical protein [Legionella santicrucis]
MLATLDYQDSKTAKDSLKAIIRKSYSKYELKQLDKMIDSINQKINANDRSLLTCATFIKPNKLNYNRRYSMAS